MEETQPETPDQELPLPDPIKKHSYPLQIKAGALAIVILLLSSLIFSPDYLTATFHLNQGRAYIKSEDYQEAKIVLKDALQEVPDSKKVKIYLAIACFSSADTLDDLEGLSYLEGLNINDEDWRKVSSVMPEAYQHFFTSK
jgi:tetratricopeptide (TPR) repeat protein